MRRKDREVTEFLEIKEILDSCKTCHVGMSDEGRPYVVPLSYGYEMEGECLILYFHSAKEGKKLDILHRNPEVCFEISNEGRYELADVPCHSGCYYSSVIGYGEVVFIDETEEKKRGLRSMFRQQFGKEELFQEKQAASVCIYKIVSREFTGKKRRMLP